MEQNSDSVSSVAHLCPILCDLVNCRTPGLPVWLSILNYSWPVLPTSKQTTHVGLLGSQLRSPEREILNQCLLVQKRRILTDVLLEAKLNEWLRLVQKGKSQPSSATGKAQRDRGGYPAVVAHEPCYQRSFDWPMQVLTYTRVNKNHRYTQESQTKIKLWLHR